MKNQKSIKLAITTNIIIFILTSVYAFVRYNVLKEPVAENNFLFLLNKALSVTAIASIGASYVVSNLNRLGLKQKPYIMAAKKYFGVYGFFVAAVHILISLYLLSPVLFGKFYDGDIISAKYMLSLMFGGASFLVFALPAIATIPKLQKKLSAKDWLKMQRFGYMGTAMVLLHLVVMGYSGWLDSSHWPGGLIPITMIGSAIALSVLSLKSASILFGNLSKLPISDIIYSKKRVPLKARTEQNTNVYSKD